MTEKQTPQTFPLLECMTEGWRTAVRRVEAWRPNWTVRSRVEVQAVAGVCQQAFFQDVNYSLDDSPICKITLQEVDSGGQ